MKRDRQHVYEPNRTAFVLKLLYTAKHDRVQLIFSCHNYLCSRLGNVGNELADDHPVGTCHVCALQQSNIAVFHTGYLAGHTRSLIMTAVRSANAPYGVRWLCGSVGDDEGRR